MDRRVEHAVGQEPVPLADLGGVRPDIVVGRAELHGSRELAATSARVDGLEKRETV